MRNFFFWVLNFFVYVGNYVIVCKCVGGCIGYKEYVLVNWYVWDWDGVSGRCML